MCGQYNPLFLDIGNTRAAWLHGDEYGYLEYTGLANSGLPSTLRTAQQIVAVSVAAPERTEIIRSCFGSTDWVSFQAPEPAFMVSTYSAEKLGRDRWLAAYAVARHSGRQGVHVVVDAGTATTIDLVKNGSHLGGWILPGRKLWQVALMGNTAIPHEEIAHPDEQPGTETGEAIASGWLAATVGAVQRMISQAGATEIWLTGGNASLLQAPLGNAHWRRNLVLDGLQFWAEAKGIVV